MKANEIRELIEQRTETTQRLYNLLYEDFIKRQYCDSIEHANNLLSTLCYNMTFFVINTISPTSIHSLNRCNAAVCVVLKSSSFCGSFL